MTLLTLTSFCKELLDNQILENIAKVDISKELKKFRSKWYYSWDISKICLFVNGILQIIVYFIKYFFIFTP